MIVIPMAGQSRRFAEAGYSKPKYMLPIGSRTVFDHAVGSFARYFATEPFLFIGLDGPEMRGFVAERCAALGVRDPRAVLLAHETSGQAETVAQGLERMELSPDAPITIFNIDTFRPDFTHPCESWVAASDGYLEVFEGTGANWSYVRPWLGPDGEPRVAETAEKRVISHLCCTGLYHFARLDDFNEAMRRERAAPAAGERYVAPLYNHLIDLGRRVHFRRIARHQVEFCGVPAEYEQCLARQR